MADEAALTDETALVSALLRNLRQNIQDDIDSRFNHLIAKENPKLTLDASEALPRLDTYAIIGI